VSTLKWLGLVLFILVAVVGGTLGARWVYDLTGQSSRPASELDPTAPANPSPATFSTDAIINHLQAYLKTHPADSVAYGNLGIWYLQKARETGDPAFYTKAEGVLTRALQIDPKNFQALSGLGALALSRHQFHDAFGWGQRAQPLNPDNAGIYGILGDAQIELGNYPEAFALFDRMVGLRPDLSSYARISYARELQGNRPGAIEAMQAAADAGAPNSEAVNWARVQLGNLYFDQGDYAEAEKAYQAALDSTPDYAYARAGLANVRAAKGDYAEAITLYTGAVNTMPLPQFVIALGDIYAAAGRPDEASRQYALVEVEEKLFAANGVDVDAEVAFFNADHDRNLPAALESARAAYERRPSITVADVLAWTLCKSGDYASAQQMMNQALHLGTRNALMYYHAGIIAYRLGNTQVARDYLDKALMLNPHFSILYADSAKKLLSSLGSQNGPSGNLEMIGEEH
jgi:tetratricopeptide (TPR) repeat protein